METITQGFLDYGILGLVIAALIAALGILWRHITAERNATAERLKELQEHHAKERETLIADTRKANAETLERVYTLTREVTKTTERVSAVIEENTKAIKEWGSRIDEMGEKVLVLCERVERLEEKQK